MTTLNPVACAAFLIAAVSLAGVCQTAWLALPWSRPLTIPLDGGLTFRGRRVFGANKTVRGFVVMIPATGLSFLLVARAFGAGPVADVGLWPLVPGDYWQLGLWAGFGFMAGELPNSFAKRQAGVAPGQAATGRAMKPVFLTLDRVDSILGLLIALAIVVPLPALTWAYVLIIGPLVHASFSAALFLLGAKARAA
jgi:CDP-2,3-bis-(O-geranylgeranyl)-sn-glycerol synthase